MDNQRKKEYMKAEFDVIMFDVCDVITTSTSEFSESNDIVKDDIFTDEYV